MKIVLTGIVVALVVAAGLGYVLGMNPTPAWKVYSSTSTRVGEPGNNLVGPRWSGENRIQTAGR